ncbi:9710_t:CDS:2, partial [Funneliformis geosporum]
MTSNTLEFYSDVFVKDTKTFLQLIANVTSHLAERDMAIAKFLEKIELPKNFIEQIAHT